jgi:hypothetical protein
MIQDDRLSRGQGGGFLRMIVKAPGIAEGGGKVCICARRRHSSDEYLREEDIHWMGAVRGLRTLLRKSFCGMTQRSSSTGMEKIDPAHHIKDGRRMSRGPSLCV